MFRQRTLASSFVCDGDMGLEAAEEKWKKGRRNQVRRLQKDENGLSGMANYITKQKHPDKKGKEPKPVGKYQKAWKASKGLKKPEVHKITISSSRRTLTKL